MELFLLYYWYLGIVALKTIRLVNEGDVPGYIILKNTVVSYCVF